MPLIDAMSATGPCSAAIDKILKDATQGPDGWFASCGEIARWVFDALADTHARRPLDHAR
jgi:hypothetical protein